MDESPNEINVEVWLPFLLSILSPDTLYKQRVQGDISEELVARFQPVSKDCI